MFIFCCLGSKLNLLLFIIISIYFYWSTYCLGAISGLIIIGAWPLEDVISAAMKDATEKASKEMEASMKDVTGGMKIPGLNF